MHIPGNNCPVVSKITISLFQEVISTLIIIISLNIERKTGNKVNTFNGTIAFLSRHEHRDPNNHQDGLFLITKIRLFNRIQL